MEKDPHASMRRTQGIALTDHALSLFLTRHSASPWLGALRLEQATGAASAFARILGTDTSGASPIALLVHCDIHARLLSQFHYGPLTYNIILLPLHLNFCSFLLVKACCGAATVAMTSLANVEIVIVAVLLPLAWVTVSLRLWVRTQMTKSLGWDDGAMLVALVNFPQTLVPSQTL